MKTEHIMLRELHVDSTEAQTRVVLRRAIISSSINRDYNDNVSMLPLWPNARILCKPARAFRTD